MSEETEQASVSGLPASPEAQRLAQAMARLLASWWLRTHGSETADTQTEWATPAAPEGRVGEAE